MKKGFYMLCLCAFTYSSFSQDVIWLKSGDELDGKVIKVGTSEVEYKKDTASPVYAIKKSEVFMIKYENGSKDVLSSLATPEKNKEAFDDLKLKYEKPKRIGIALLATGGALFLVGSSIVAVEPISASCLMGASIPFFAIGGVQMHKYVKYKREWKDAQRSVSFAPNGIRINF